MLKRELEAEVERLKEELDLGRANWNMTKQELDSSEAAHQLELERVNTDHEHEMETKYEHLERIRELARLLPEPYRFETQIWLLAQDVNPFTDAA